MHEKLSPFVIYENTGTLSRFAPYLARIKLPKSQLRASVQTACLVAHISVQQDFCVHLLQKWPLRAFVFKSPKTNVWIWTLCSTKGVLQQRMTTTNTVRVQVTWEMVHVCCIPLHRQGLDTALTRHWSHWLPLFGPSNPGYIGRGPPLTCGTALPLTPDNTQLGRDPGPTSPSLSLITPVPPFLTLKPENTGHGALLTRWNHPPVTCL